MNLNHSLPHRRLIDYLVFVGPGKGSNLGAISPKLSNYQDFVGSPVIINRIPTIDHEDFELSSDVAYFCQPEGHTHIDEPKTHVFMLTNTVTNIKTYGVCLSLPHLFDPPSKHAANGSDDFIQEWGVLSLCLLSKHPFFNFLTQSLITLAHFVQDFGETEPLWRELLHHKCSHPDSPRELVSMRRRERMLSEIVGWIEQLLSLDAPEPGSALEVELEVDPALVIAYPSAARLPLFDLSVHRMFSRLDVCTVIDIFKLVLSEHKVIVHSNDHSFVSECVLTVLTLLYPVQYLFPVIPLLPTSMPTAENLLGVPTPFFIGVCSSFLLNVHEMLLSEVWLINLDTKEIKAPSPLDQPVLEFPYSILQLQADVRLALDKLEDINTFTPTGSHVTKPGGHMTSTPTSTTHALSQVVSKLSASASTRQSPSQLLYRENSLRKHIENDVDVMLRAAFVEFLFGPEILGLIEQYLCIYRLFPRPVVIIRKSAFLSAYNKTNTTVDPNFMRDLLCTQAVEYFFEWSLNPENSAYEEIKRGVNEVSRLSDKQFHYIHHQAFKTKQVCLYHQSPDSLLYQEMLVYKATQTSPLHHSSDVQLPDDEDSDWEAVTRGDFYDGDSESSYCTDNAEQWDGSSSPFPIIGQGAVAVGCATSEDRDADEVEVGYCSTKRVSSPAQGIPQVVIQRQSSQPAAHLLHQTSHMLQRPKSMVTMETNSEPSLGYVRRSLSFEHLSLSDEHSNSFSCHLGDQSTAYLTSSEYLTAHQFDSDTDHAHTNDRSTGHSEYSPYTSEDDFRRLYSHKQRGVAEKDHVTSYRSHNDTLRESSKSSGSSEQLDFVTPASTLPRQHSANFGEESPGGGQVIRTVLALSALNNSKIMDNQIKDIVGKVVGGQGLPWPKPAALKKLAMQEGTRVLILRHLEEKLGVRTSNEVVMANNAQITPVGISKPVYRGILDLLKLLLHNIEEDFLREPESPVFSFFLLLRVAFSVYHEPKAKTTVGFSLRSALSIGTSLLATEATRESTSSQGSPLQVTTYKTPGDVSRTRLQAEKTQSITKSTATPLHNGPSPKSTSQSTLTATPPPNGSTSPNRSLSSLSLTPELASKQNRLSSIAKQDDLLNQLVNSPRFYHPREGQDVRSFNFLYKELLKGQGNMRPFLIKKEFWNNLFISSVDADRGYLGWNERTADLYQRYNSLPEVHRRTFGSDEDHLLSIIAHNLLVYMLMVGLSPKETMLLINNFTARTRLATFEEKLLQQTIRYVENNASNEIDLSYLGLMALYSEIHPTISHIIHYGVSMIAPVYKLQITNEALILRRFPDERIAVRLWNDRISVIERNETRATVSVRYKSQHGEFSHHFHTKQYQKVYESLRALVHVASDRKTFH